MRLGRLGTGITWGRTRWEARAGNKPGIGKVQEAKTYLGGEGSLGSGSGGKPALTTGCSVADVVPVLPPILETWWDQRRLANDEDFRGRTVGTRQR